MLLPSSRLVEIRRQYACFPPNRYLISIPCLGLPVAAVQLVDSVLQDLDDATKQKIAAEMNLSETAFVTCLHTTDSFDSSVTFRLRWFTPSVEVDLCGHATLAAATILFFVSGNQNRMLHFETRSGTLLAMHKEDSIALGFPQDPPMPLDQWNRTKIKPLLDYLGEVVGEDSVIDIQLAPTSRKLLLRLRDNTSMPTLQGFRVDIPTSIVTSKSITEIIRGVILTVKGSVENQAVDGEGVPYDFVSRYFAPFVGIPEDPVTGSAHTVLGPYWNNLQNKNTLYAFQCSSRGGSLQLTLQPNNRIEITGHSRIVLRGVLEI
ncbi:hypothetical protein RvY_01010-2 [Ramazzottius varieornatus]|uniref:Phenazine biosynthesis-like domain-containing protein n=1 Tax=Ramazzottius varieornatus TaxID=947166 RepID=A0A1D1UQ43_RAMVA|nr:hypothetical protein RvY_01010-2 [Ramazzottius varieornatus]